MGGDGRVQAALVRRVASGGSCVALARAITHMGDYLVSCID